MSFYQGVLDEDKSSLSSHNPVGGLNSSNVDAGEFQTTIDWYVQQGLDNSILRYCNDTQKKLGVGMKSSAALQYGNIVGLESLCLLWKAYALTNQNQRLESIRILSMLNNIHEMKLVVTASLITSTKSRDETEMHAIRTACSNYGIQIASLTDTLKSLTRGSSYVGLITTARYFLYIDKLKQSKHCIDRALEIAPNNIGVLSLGGYIYLASGSARYQHRALQQFDTALSVAEQYKAQCMQQNALIDDGNGNGPNDPFQTVSTKHNFLVVSAVFGRCLTLISLGLITQYPFMQVADEQFKQKHTQQTQRPATVIDDLNLVYVTLPSFLPALVEKAKLFLTMREWDDALSVLNRILVVDGNSVTALFLTLNFAITREGNNIQRILLLSKGLIAAIHQKEPTNMRLYMQLATLLSNFSTKPLLLTIAVESANRAYTMSTEQNNTTVTSQSLALLGTLYHKLGLFQQSTFTFQTQSQLDPDSLDAILGKIGGNIAFEKFQAASTELDFVTVLLDEQPQEEIQTHHSMLVYYYAGVLAWKWRQDEPSAIFLFKQALNIFDQRFTEYSATPSILTDEQSGVGKTAYRVGSVQETMALPFSLFEDVLSCLCVLSSPGMTLLSTQSHSTNSLFTLLRTTTYDTENAQVAATSVGGALRVVECVDAVLLEFSLCCNLLAFKATALTCLGDELAVETCMSSISLLKNSLDTGLDELYPSALNIQTKQVNNTHPFNVPFVINLNIVQFPGAKSLTYTANSVTNTQDKQGRFFEAVMHVNMARSYFSKAIAANDGRLDGMKIVYEAGDEISQSSSVVNSYCRQAVECLEAAIACDFWVKMYLPYVTLKAWLCYIYMNTDSKSVVKSSILQDYTKSTLQSICSMCEETGKLPGVLKKESGLPFVFTFMNADFVLQQVQADTPLDKTLQVCVPGMYNQVCYSDRLFFVTLYSYLLMSNNRSKDVGVITQYIYKETKRSSTVFTSHNKQVDTTTGYHPTPEIKQHSLLVTLYVKNMVGSNNSDIGIVYDTRQIKQYESLLLLFNNDVDGAVRRLSKLPLHLPHLRLGRVLSQQTQYSGKGKDVISYSQNFLSSSDVNSYEQQVSFAEICSGFSQMSKALEYYNLALGSLTQCINDCTSEKRKTVLRCIHSYISGQVGDVLVAMHDYGGAVRYYSSVLQSTKPVREFTLFDLEFYIVLRLQLAGIYIFADAPALALHVLLPVLIQYSCTSKQCGAVIESLFRREGEWNQGIDRDQLHADGMAIRGLFHKTWNVSYVVCLTSVLAAHLTLLLDTELMSVSTSLLHLGVLASQQAMELVSTTHQSRKMQSLCSDVYLCIAWSARGEAWVFSNDSSELSLLSAYLEHKTHNLHRYTTAQSLESSLEFFTEASRIAPHYNNAKICYAKILLERNMLDDCVLVCLDILHQPTQNPQTDIAVNIVLAEARLAQGDLEKALPIFNDVFSRNPKNVQLQLRIIQTLNMGGKIATVGGDLIQTSCDCYGNRALWPPGLWLAKGLYATYCYDADEAIFCYLQCRKAESGSEKNNIIGGMYGEMACIQSVYCYLQFDISQMQIIASQSVSNNHAVSNSQYNSIGQDESRLEQAELLLKMLESYYSRKADDNNNNVNTSPARLEAILLEAYLHLCRSAKSERKNKLELAVGLQTSVQKVNREHPGASLAIAVALGLSGQHAKAKNQFKRYASGVARISGGLVDLSLMHKESMLVCQAYVCGKSKPEEAKDGFLKCIAQHSNCVRAHTALAYIEQSNGNLATAMTYYQNAWNLCNESDPQIGYQYAAMCLKNKKYVEAARVSQKIAYAFPDFGKIKKEVLEAAKEALSA